MNIEDFNGYITFREEVFPFTFHKNTITILPYSLEKWNELSGEWFYRDFDKHDNKKWLDKIILDGITDKREGVKFFVTDNPAFYNGYYSFKVEFLYVYNHKKDVDEMEDIIGIKFSGPEFNYLYDISGYITSDFETKDNKFHKFNLELSSKEDKKLGKFRWHSYSVSVSGGFSWRKNNDAYSPLEVNSIIRLELSSICTDLYKIIDLVNIQKQVMFFMTYRKNITFNKIEMYNYTSDGLRKNVGNLYIFTENSVCENDIKNLKKIIDLQDINENFAKLYKMVIDNKIYMNHICEDMHQRNKYYPSRMLSILIAFEHTYNSFHKDKIIVNDDFEYIRKMTLDYLESEKKNFTGKKKDKIRKMINSISKLKLDYGEYLKNALLDNYLILKPFILKQYEVKNAKPVISSCSKRINKIRNSMAHGILDINFKPINSRDIHIIEYLIYCMILREMKISDDVIMDKLKKIFNIYI